MQPIIYSSQDADAPQLSLTAGALNTVLKGCLVTGYGDNPAAGWEIVHEDIAAHKLAIRSTSPKSINSVLLLNNIATDRSLVTAYTSWDSTNNIGVNNFGSGIFFSKWKINTPDWVLIATDTFFYLAIANFIASGTTYYVISAFGDMNTFASDIEGCCGLVSQIDAQYEFQQLGLYKAQTTLGDAVFPQPVTAPKNTLYGWGDAPSEDIKGSSSGVAMFTRFPLYVDKDGAKQPLVALPGMLMPFTSVKGIPKNRYSFSELEVPASIAPLIGIYQPYSARAWLKTDDWG